MAEEFRFEDPGEGIHEGEIVKIHVSQGDRVADGDIVLTVETDKAAVDVPSPVAGTISEIRISEGDIVEVGDVLMVFDAGGRTEKDGPKERDREPARSKRDEEPESDEKDQEDEKGEEDGAKKAEADGRRDAQRPSGRTNGSAGEGRDTRSNGHGPVPAAPATRRLARELGVALDDVEPSGPHGRVTAEDVQRAAEGGARAEREPDDERREDRRGAGDRRKRAQAVGGSDLAPLGAAPLPDFEQWGEVERRPLRSIRRATAKRMARSWAEIPHVTHQDAVAIADLERFRKAHASAVEQAGGKLTLTVLVMKALIAALKEHPRFNASLDADAEEIVLKRYYNIGVAIDTEAGLYVPVIRDADRKSLIELSTELVALAEKARVGELGPDDMRGGTFTITNVGPLGGRAFTPIINHPEAAILGLARATMEPHVEGDLDDHEIGVRLMLPICLAFDHRINDGADAARFMSTLIERLSDSESMVLHL